MIHELKSWPKHFQAILDTSRSFEIRLDENQLFAVGGTLYLREFSPCPRCQGGDEREWDVGDKTTCEMCEGMKGRYTGRELCREVTYLVRNAVGLRANYVVMAIQRPR